MRPKPKSNVMANIKEAVSAAQAAVRRATAIGRTELEDAT